MTPSDLVNEGGRLLAMLVEGQLTNTAVDVGDELDLDRHDAVVVIAQALACGAASAMSAVGDLAPGRVDVHSAMSMKLASAIIQPVADNPVLVAGMLEALEAVADILGELLNLALEDDPTGRRMLLEALRVNVRSDS